MAGLYDVWKNPEGEDVYSYTVITTDPCSSLTFLHDRMPLLLDNDEEIDQWLNVEVPFEEVKKMLLPYKGNLEIFPVSTFVSKLGHDSEECVKPITKKMEGRCSFFLFSLLLLKGTQKTDNPNKNNPAQKITSWFKNAETKTNTKKEEENTQAAAAVKPEEKVIIKGDDEEDEEDVPLLVNKKRAAAEVEGETADATAPTTSAAPSTTTPSTEPEKKPEVKRIKLSDLNKRDPAKSESQDSQPQSQPQSQPLSQPQLQPTEQPTEQPSSSSSSQPEAPVAHVNKDEETVEEDDEETKAQTVAALGFSLKVAKKALRKFEGDVNQACDWLLSADDE